MAQCGRGEDLGAVCPEAIDAKNAGREVELDRVSALQSLAASQLI